MAKRKLKQFLYRNDDIVAQYLEQLEQGAIDSIDVGNAATGNLNLGGSVHVGPLEATAAKGQTTDSSSSFTLRQTASSKFARFEQLADEDALIQSLDGMDLEIWNSITPGEIISLPISLSIPEVITSLDAMSGLSGIMPLIHAFQTTPGLAIEGLPSQEELASASLQLDLLTRADSWAESQPIPATATHALDDRYRFWFLLQRDALIASRIADLNGTCKILASVTRSLKKGEQYVVPILNLVPTSNRAERRAKTKGQSDPNQVTIRHPGAELNPIAIYR